MEEEKAFFRPGKHYFWIAFFLIVLIFFSLGFNVFKPQLFFFVSLSLFIIVLFWDKTWMLVTLALVSIPFGNIVPLVIKSQMTVDISLVEVLIFLSFGSYFLQTLFGRFRLFWKHFLRDNVFILLVLYAVFSTCSYFQIVDAKLFFFQSRVIFLGLITYMVTRVFFDTKEKIRWFFSGLSVAVLILAIQTFFLLVENGYSLALFYDRNFLLLPVGAIAFVSAIIAVILPALAGCFLSETDTNIKFLSGSALVFGFIALLLLLSKAAIGSFFLGMLYIVWKTKRKFIMPISTFFGGVTFLLFLFSPFLTKLIERSIRVFTDANSQYRILEYKLSWTILQDHWFLGVGTGQQPIYFQKIYYADFINLVNNYLLQGWLDLGVIGLFILIVLTVVVAKRGLFLVKKSRSLPWEALSVGLVGSLVTAFFNGFAEVTFFGMFYIIIFASLLGVIQNLSVWKKSQ